LSIFPQAIGTVAAFAGFDGGVLAPTARPGTAGPTTTAPANVRGDNARLPQDVRLVIEQDGQTGSFVYKTVVRSTGDILTQYPRDQLLEIGCHANYKSGSVISMSA